jgi:hypothetical protein
MLIHPLRESTLEKKDLKFFSGSNKLPEVGSSIAVQGRRETECSPIPLQCRCTASESTFSYLIE